MNRPGVWGSAPVSFDSENQREMQTTISDIDWHLAYDAYAAAIDAGTLDDACCPYDFLTPDQYTIAEQQHDTNLEIRDIISHGADCHFCT